MYGGLAERGTFGQARERNGSREFPQEMLFPVAEGTVGAKALRQKQSGQAQRAAESKVAEQCEQGRPEEGRSREVIGPWWEGGSCRVLEPRERTLPF